MVRSVFGIRPMGWYNIIFGCLNITIDINLLMFHVLWGQNEIRMWKKKGVNFIYKFGLKN
jgi:hypothetical protein